MRVDVHETSIVSRDADIADGTTIGPFCVIEGNVSIGAGTHIGSHSVLGEGSLEAPCRIGRDALIRSHAVIYAGAEMADGFECGHRVTIREGTRIGSNVRIGTLSDIQGNLSIGDHARLHSNVHIGQGSTIEELTWIFPYVVLTNDPHPPSDTCTNGPTVRRFAVIATHSTILPGIEIGEGALVGAMSLVRSDVPPHTVVAGVPAKEFGPTSAIVCHDGKLEQVYPWWRHFRRGYPEGVLPPADAPPDG